jgi:hypothetical protein
MFGIQKQKEPSMTQQRAAIIVLSDPRAATEEALGRVFNALAAAYDFKRAGDQVTILFQGTGTRWLAELTRADHPAHDLFESVKDAVAGASLACATVFGAADDVTRAGFDLVSNNAIPGTPGLPSLRALGQDGYRVLVF